MEATMLNQEFQARLDEVKRRARGQWKEILVALGVDPKVVNRRNQPCPLCGGTDRFQYTDYYGDGNYHCRGCGPGDGWKLLQGLKGLRFGEALKAVEEQVGVVRTARKSWQPEPSAERMKKLAKRIWDEGRPVTAGDEVDRYLRGRGLELSEYPGTLRCHAALGYYEKDASSGKSVKVAEYAAMLACIQGADDHAVTLHRTYLQDGRKALGRESKKVLSSGINGAAVRLFQASEELAIAEGIETAIAVHLATGRATWAAISAGNMERLWIPPTVRRVCIYADNDANSEYDGQAAAFLLARRLMKESKKSGDRVVEVFVPRTAGVDWADVWVDRVRHRKAA